MPDEGTVPAAPARDAMNLRRALAAMVIAAGSSAACTPADHVLLQQSAPDQRQVALVTLTRCGTGWCERLLVGGATESATSIATLPQGSEHVNEVAWSKDGRRVAFLVNGYQLRIYDAETRAPAGQLTLVNPDANPPTRIARGVTFSDNGAAVTFDDCPRDRSGCRPGLVAMR
jgi:hypothetical protein